MKQETDEDEILNSSIRTAIRGWFYSYTGLNQESIVFVGNEIVLWDNKHCTLVRGTLIHHQGIICCVAFARSSLRRIAPYASVVAPRRLASDALLMIRAVFEKQEFQKNPEIDA